MTAFNPATMNPASIVLEKASESSSTNLLLLVVIIASINRFILKN